MIIRSSNVDRPEPLQQGSLTGMRGIDYTKPVTANNVVNDMCNLDVNTDGTLSIRKPLIADRTYSNGSHAAIKVIPLYDSAYSMVIYKNNSFSIEDSSGTKCPVQFYGEYVDYSGMFEISLGEQLSKGNVYNVKGFIDISNVSAINTTSSTVLGNTTVDITNTLVSEHLYNPKIISASQATAVPRYISIVKANDEAALFKVTIKTPEVNTLNTGGDLVLDPNLTLDAPYALRDIYNSRYLSVNGILPYTRCNTKDTPSTSSDDTSEKINIDASLDNSYDFNRKEYSMLLPYDAPILDFGITHLKLYSSNFEALTRGGIIKIWFNTFNPKAELYNTDRYNPADVQFITNTVKPSKVMVEYSTIIAGALYTSDAEGNVDVEPYNENDRYILFTKVGTDGNNKIYPPSGAILNRHKYAPVRKVVFESDNIEYDEGDTYGRKGYYIELDEVPLMTHLVLREKLRYNDMEHKSDGNIRPLIKDGMPSSGYLFEYSGKITNHQTKTDCRYEYLISCAPNDTQTVANGAYYRIYDADDCPGVIDFDIKITVEYEVGSSKDPLKFTSHSYINIFKHFWDNVTTNGQANFILPWFEDDSYIHANYPAYIYEGSEVASGENKFIQDYSFTEDSSVLADKATPQTFTTELHLNVATTESTEIKKSLNIVQSPRRSSASGRTMPIDYTTPSVNTTVIRDATVYLKGHSPSVITDVTLTFKDTDKDDNTKTLKTETAILTYDNPSYKSSVEYNRQRGNASENIVQSTIFVNFTGTEGGIPVDRVVEQTVKTLTEQVNYPKFQLTNVLKADASNTVLLKAFMNLTNTTDLTYYGIWEYSKDGIEWQSYYTPSDDDAPVSKGYFKKIKLPSYTVSEQGTVDVNTDITLYNDVYGVLFSVDNENDELFSMLDSEGEPITNDNFESLAYVVPKRADVVYLKYLKNEDKLNSFDLSNVYSIPSELPLRSLQFRFTVVKLKNTENGENVEILAVGRFLPNVGLKWEFASTELGNAVLGDKLYHRNTVYSYNHADFNNSVLASDVGSYITPLSRIVDLSSNAESTVTALVPWRDYLVAFTDNDVHLISNVDGGFYTKTVSTFIGVSNKDRRTCKSILNGIVFKSENKFYTLYPNYASGDDTILNLNEISTPIDHILKELPVTDYECFSISSNDAYYTFIPYDDYTICVKYKYDVKLWQMCRYDGVRITDYEFDTVDNIYLYGYCKNIYTKYYFNKHVHDVYPDFNAKFNVETLGEVPYGDYLTLKSLEADVITGLPTPTPIDFKLDTGQRIDNISPTKQFVETKIILATQSEKPAANMTVDVYVDGIPVKTRTKGDGMFYKTSSDDVLTFGDAVVHNNDSVLDTVTQAYLKYSGKGKTIRHVITGESLYDFKLYELFYRYRIMPNKP